MNVLRPAALLTTFLIAGCAAPLRFPPGQDLLHGEPPRLPVPPDSLRADLEFTVLTGKIKTSVSARLSAVPNRRYKLDLFGLPGMPAGSFLWDAGRWSWVAYADESYREGEGELLELKAFGLESVSVHDLFSFLWGDFFPGAEDDFPNGGAGRNWILQLDSATGLVKRATQKDRGPPIRIAFGEYRRAGGRPLSGETRFFSGDRPLLKMRVKRVEDNPVWRQTPFFLKIPDGFKRVQTPE